MFEIVRLIVPEEKYLADINKLVTQQSPGKEGMAVSLGDLRYSIKNKNFYLFLAIEDGVCVGMATIFFQRNIVRWIAEIHDIVVDQDHRGKGIGERLTKKLIETASLFAEHVGQKIKLYLTSRPSRVAANNLYQKLGFVMVAQATGEWGTNLYKIMIEPKNKAV